MKILLICLFTILAGIIGSYFGGFVMLVLEACVLVYACSNIHESF